MALLPHMFWIQSSLFGGVFPWVKLQHSSGIETSIFEGALPRKCCHIYIYYGFNLVYMKLFAKETMIEENWQLVIDEHVEFEKQPVEVQDCWKITDRFKRIYII